MPGIRQFSAHVTKRHACHRICMLSPLDPSKALRLPRKMTMQLSKVLRLPRRMKLIFCKRRKSIARATQNGFRRAMKHVGMSQSATLARRNEATRRLEPPESDHFCRTHHSKAIRPSCGRLRTVADGCTTPGEHSLSPQNPRGKREPLLCIQENMIDIYIYIIFSR